jgi:hypothetical protein
LFLRPVAFGAQALCLGPGALVPMARKRLVETLDAEGAGHSGSRGHEAGGKRRQLNRRDTEQMVDRIIGEHFEGFTKVQTDIMTVNGLTLRETLLQQKRAKKGEGRRLGTKLYAELRDAYALDSSPGKLLKVANPDEMVQQPLVEALAAASCANPAKRSKQPLYNFFSSVKDLNQKELVGLLRSISGVSVTKSVPARKHAFEVLKFLVNSDLDQKFAADILCLKHMFDEVLALTYISMKKEHMPIATWWQNFGEYVRVLGCKQDFDEIMQEETDWGNVAAQLKRVVSSTDLGQKMFGAAASMVLLSAFSISVDAKLAVLKQSAFTDAKVQECKDRLTLQCMTMLLGGLL